MPTLEVARRAARRAARPAARRREPDLVATAAPAARPGVDERAAHRSASSSLTPPRARARAWWAVPARGHRRRERGAARCSLVGVAARGGIARERAAPARAEAAARPAAARAGRARRRPDLDRRRRPRLAPGRADHHRRRARSRRTRSTPATRRTRSSTTSSASRGRVRPKLDDVTFVERHVDRPEPRPSRAARRRSATLAPPPPRHAGKHARQRSASAPSAAPDAPPPLPAPARRAPTSPRRRPRAAASHHDQQPVREPMRTLVRSPSRPLSPSARSRRARRRVVADDGPRSREASASTSSAASSLYGEADYRAALVEFKRAYALAPNAGGPLQRRRDAVPAAGLRRRAHDLRALPRRDGAGGRPPRRGRGRPRGAAGARRAHRASRRSRRAPT